MSTAPTVAIPAHRAPPANIRLLLVEDNEADAFLVRRQLTRSEWSRHLQLDHVSTLGEACTRLATTHYDCALLDLGLPDSDGIESIHRLRPLAPEMPVIVVTGHNDEAQAIEALQHGAQEYVVKNSYGDGSALLRIIRLALERHRTERKQARRLLRANAERVRAIVETVPDAIMTIDDAGIIETVNPAAEKMFQFDAIELVGRNVRLLLDDPRAAPKGPPNTGFWRELAGRLGDVQLRRRDGTGVPAEVAVGEIDGGERIMYATVVRDVSERKLAERELRRLNTSLKAGIREREAALRKLQAAQQQLVQTERLASLGEMVAGISHEINTPVGIGVTAASHLADKAASFRSAYENDALDRRSLEEFLAATDQATGIILTNLRRAADLIGSFKQVAVDQSSAERREFGLRQLFEEILLSLRPKLKHSKLDVEVDCDAHWRVYSYPGAFSQILTNFIVNSLVHGYEPEAAGRVHILAERSDGGLTLTYRDDGKGIAEDNLKRIFDPFFTTARNRGGSGLGMHIVYNLVTQTLGGRIQVDSRQGAGTCFRLELPLDVQGETP